MPQAWFRFYGELNDFLPPSRRQKAFPHRFDLSAPVKDMIEGLGVPHPEVELILANGESVGFHYLVRDGDRISVFPVFESLDIGPLVRVRPAPLRHPRFVLDAHLGKLAAYLRLLGFDSIYRSDASDHELANLAGEGRILLTRDAGLLKHGSVTHGYYVRETEPRRQAAEVVRRFQLERWIEPFTRCLRCNGLLERLEGDPPPSIPAAVRQRHTEFWRCPGCGRHYWKGSHYRRMQEWVRAIR
ncbi:MAG: Mut7-C RNAse domain-containing protein [Bryobacterales bacterium]|nr:Mut7-C ubiquitin/RNAse domain-containing protein [Bryobacteraceae bacterium]MDW8129257.1 Mut7-C RNAse domain-containing protein [Bryobacterales bacterium]